MVTHNSDSFTEISQISKCWPYSGGEIGVRLLPEVTKDYNPNIFCRIQNSDDLMYAVLTVDSLLRLEHKPICLIIPYLPYARQDRVVTYGDQVALEVFLSFFKSVGVKKIISNDIHSEYAFDIAEELGIELEDIPQIETIPILKIEQEFEKESVILIAPDFGSRSKVFKLQDYIDDFVYDILFCEKVRDPITGNLSNIRFSNEIKKLKPNTNWLLVDDICDGGGTFLMIADLLQQTYGAKAHLFTTHGIYSKGLDELCDKFLSVGSSCSFLSSFHKAERMYKSNLYFTI